MHCGFSFVLKNCRHAERVVAMQFSGCGAIDVQTQTSFRENAGKSAAGFTNLTLSFQRHVCTVLPPPEESAERLLEVSELSLTLPPSPEHIERTTKSSSQKQSVAKKPAWKDEMSESDRVQERADLANLDKRHNFIKNPRFQPPHIQRGGKSLIVPPRKVERMVAGRRLVVEERDPYEPIPVFLANPPVVFFTNYRVGQIYEVLFLPSSSDVFKQTFTIVCDNCQVKDIAVTGTGQLIALQLMSVTGGEDTPIPGELTDLTAEHFIRFGALNPHSGEQKKVVIRNATHLELPFHWQMMKPNLKPLMPGEAIEPDGIEYNLATDKAFDMSPGQGILAPHHDHDFILSYCPHEMWNNSIAHITFDWERISDCHILEVEPLTGVIEPNECCDLELALTGGKPGSSTLSLLCHIEHHPEPVTLHVEAAFKGPQVCIDLPSLDLGLMKLGDSALSTIQLNNISQLAASWSLQECPSDQPEVPVILNCTLITD
ncbi:UNVERIFIED_CONTAM: hypothetical protein FKN15_053520 [Acipenser sinensis]